MNPEDDNNQPPESRPLEDAMNRLRDSLERAQIKLQAEIDAAPKESKCERHGKTVLLDRDASEEAGEVTYAPCPGCEREAKIAKFRKWQEQVGIPADVRHATFSNFDASPKPDGGSVAPAEFAQAGRAFAQGEIRNLILAGTTGIGKGHIAAAICAELLARRGTRRVKWLTAANLFAGYHRAYTDNSNAEYIAYLASRAVLILDECAFRDLPKDGEQVLFELIDARQKGAAQTILLTNASKGQFVDWLGERCVSRLRSGGNTFLWGSWQDARGTEADRSQSL